MASASGVGFWEGWVIHEGRVGVSVGGREWGIAFGRGDGMVCVMGV